MCHSVPFSCKQKKQGSVNSTQKDLTGRVPGSSQIEGMTRGQGLRREAASPEDAAMAPRLGHRLLPVRPPKQVLNSPCFLTAMPQFCAVRMAVPLIGSNQENQVSGLWGSCHTKPLQCQIPQHRDN